MGAVWGQEFLDNTHSHGTAQGCLDMTTLSVYYSVHTKGGGNTSSSPPPHLQPELPLPPNQVCRELTLWLEFWHWIEVFSWSCWWQQIPDTEQGNRHHKLKMGSAPQANGTSGKRTLSSLSREGHEHGEVKNMAAKYLVPSQRRNWQPTTQNMFALYKPRDKYSTPYTVYLTLTQPYPAKEHQRSMMPTYFSSLELKMGSRLHLPIYLLFFSFVYTSQLLALVAHQSYKSYKPGIKFCYS